MKIKLTYFKAFGGGPLNLGGKYYSTGEFESKSDMFHEFLDEIEDLIYNKNLPGLMKGSSEFHVYVDETDTTPPYLFINRSFQSPKGMY